MSLIAFSSNVASIALWTLLVIVPILAIIAAVVDHVLVKRKKQLDLPPSEPRGHAFPVILPSVPSGAPLSAAAGDGQSDAGQDHGGDGGEEHRPHHQQ